MAPKPEDVDQATPPGDTTPAPVNPRDVALQAIATKAIYEAVGKNLRTLRDEAPDAVFERGDRFSVRSPLDRKVKLGTVSASDPKVEAKIVNQAVFDQWVLDNHPDDCVDVDVVAATDAELLAVLREHAPHLIRTDVKPAEWVAPTVIKLSAAAGEPVSQHNEMDDQAPPAVEILEKKSVLTIDVEDDALEHVAELWRASRVDPFHQLPAAS